MKNAQNSLLRLGSIAEHNSELKKLLQEDPLGYTSRKTEISKANVSCSLSKLQGIYQEKQKLAKLTLARYQSQENTLEHVSRKTKINEATIKNALARQLVNKL